MNRKSFARAERFGLDKNFIFNKVLCNTAKQVMESILTNSSATRGEIGVEPQSLCKELAESVSPPKDTTGVLISGVLEGGPADKAGIKPGVY